MPRELTPQQLTERSVTKKFRKEIWNTFIEGTKRYRLIEDGDRIAVSLDGGAYTLLTAKLLQQLQRVSDTGFTLFFTPAQNADFALIRHQAATLGIPLTETASAEDAAMLQRCNKITSSENYNKVVASALCDILYRSRLKVIPPRETAQGSKAEIIRPLYCISDEAVAAFVRYNGIRCAEAPAEDEQMVAVRQLIAKQKSINPLIEHNIFTGLHAVCLDTLPGYIQNGEEHTFTEAFNDVLTQDQS